MSDFVLEKPQGYSSPWINNIQPVNCKICGKHHGDDVREMVCFWEPPPCQRGVLYCPDNPECRKIAEKSVNYYALKSGFIPFLWISSNLTDLLHATFLIPRRSSEERSVGSINQEHCYAFAIPSSNILSINVTWKQDGDRWHKTVSFLETLKKNSDSDELIALAKGLFDKDKMPPDAVRFLEAKNLLGEIREWLDNR